MELTMEQYGKYIKNAAPHLSAGAFLTTKSSGRVNTMTIGWGTFGFQWGMPTFEAMVRESRFSKAAMDSEETFTVTIPYGTDMRSAIAEKFPVVTRTKSKNADLCFPREWRVRPPRFPVTVLLSSAKR